MDQNALVERAVRFNRLVTPDQLAQAKSELAMKPDKPLLQILLDLGFIGEGDAQNVLQMVEKGMQRTAAPAAAPRPAPPAAGGTAAGAPPTAAASAPAARPSDTLRMPERPAAPPPRPTDTLRMPERPAPGSGQAPGSGGPRISTERPGAAPAPAPAPAAPPFEMDADRIASFTDLEDYLAFAREVGASDLHLSVGCPPVIRRFGRLVSMPRDPLEAHETQALLFRILTPEQEQLLQEKLAIDFCSSVAGQGRYRSCIVKQRLGWDGSFRVIPRELPSFEDLGLPEQLKRLTEYHQGLVLITGPNGCGKSTTMAAMIELINQNRSDHIITLEDPIEYALEPKGCQITQREAGSHTKSFANALRAALREDPDVIVIGEMRDLETVSLAITAAETGHLVFGTLHTTSAARTIDRILDVFAADEQNQVRNMVSESLRGVVCQQLIPRKDGNGRVVALEVLFNTAAVANIIRERKLFQMPSLLQTGRKQGMLLLDNSLLELVNQGVIDGTDAYFAADTKTPFAKWAPRPDGAPAGG